MKQTLLSFVITALSLGSLARASSVSDSPDPGQIHFIIRSGSDWNFLTDNPSSSTKTFFQSHYWRFQTTPGYFDHDLSWYPNAFAYLDSYAIYRGQSVASQHPDWILKDGNGNKLYIPWGCSNGSCPQYAGDISNQSFRNYIISEAKADLAAGYKGLWIDDVNLKMQVGNGSGKTVAPIDRATGKSMTVTAWEHYFADFMTQIRSALPNAEILHNSIWYSGSGNPGSDPYVQQEIKAADYINREHGVLDAGLTGDNGYWSIQSLFRFFDTVHSLGSHFSLQETSSAGSYSVAAYFLNSEGMDAFGAAAKPSAWQAIYDVSLGSPQGSRYAWNGLIRRDFTGGSVFLNPPGQPYVNTGLGSGYKSVSGSSVSTVSLGGSQGLILLKSGGSVAPPPVASGQPIANGSYTLKNAYSGFLLDDAGCSLNPGTQAIQWPANGGTNQKWNFVWDSAQSAYLISNGLATQLYLSDINDNLMEQYQDSPANQYWIVQKVSNGYVLQNKTTGRAMDDPGLSKTQGVGIITWSPTGGSNQSWTIQ
jgi:hypothetical protein